MNRKSASICSKSFKKYFQLLFSFRWSDKFLLIVHQRWLSSPKVSCFILNYSFNLVLHNSNKWQIQIRQIQQLKSSQVVKSLTHSHHTSFQFREKMFHCFFFPQLILVSLRCWKCFLVLFLTFLMKWIRPAGAIQQRSKVRLERFFASTAVETPKWTMFGVKEAGQPTGRLKPNQGNRRHFKSRFITVFALICYISWFYLWTHKCDSQKRFLFLF